MNIAVILASGLGLRFSTKCPKQFLVVNSKEVIVYTLETFLRNTQIDLTIVVIPPNFELFFNTILKKSFSAKEIKKIIVITGGCTRFLSLISACNYISTRFNNQIFKINLITHDGDRPNLSPEILKTVVEEWNILNDSSAVLSLGIPVCDTIYNNQKNVIVPREYLYSLQTPQVCNLQSLLILWNKLIIKKNNDEIIKESQNFSDLTSIFLKYNKKVKIIKGSAENIKITVPEDLTLFKYFISQK